MPCVYLPGPAPAVTVANRYRFCLKQRCYPYSKLTKNVCSADKNMKKMIVKHREIVRVSLPWGHFQGIKHMMMLTKHGLILTCTQKNYIFMFTQHIIIYLGITPCAKGERITALTWKVDFLLLWQIPIHSGPLPGINCPPLTFQPPPLPTPLAHTTYITMTTSTILVFLVRNSSARQEENCPQILPQK